MELLPNINKQAVYSQKTLIKTKVLWIIEDGDYIGQVRDGVYHDLHKEN